MFIIPVGNRVNWKRPPVVTLLLILANCLVFFILQGNDRREEEKAEKFYFTSDLPQWELPRYAEYLEAKGDLVSAQQIKGMIDRKNSGALWLMEYDAKFMQVLHANEIITLHEQHFSAWSTQRAKYESLRSFTSRYVYRVDDPKPLNLLASTFMHGSFGHLFGNMAVLFLIGFLVESVVGKALFLSAYLVTACTAIGMYSLTVVDPGQSILGASGAIAGVMGLYTVIFGLRKIDFFYSLGFYFDYVRAPALVLLPLWLGNELYQFLVERGAHIAYMAHFGGLVGGAVIGMFYRWMRPAMIDGHHQEAEKTEVDAKAFQCGMDLLGAMEFQKALVIFKSLRERHPHDLNLKRLCYRAAKADPSSEDYHRAALRLLSVPEMDEDTSRQTHAIFHEYLDCAKPVPRLEQELLARLAKRFADANYFDDAERLAGLLQRTTPQHRALPAILLSLARGYYREQHKDKFETILQSLIHQFPQSEEARAAGSMLRIG